MESDRVKFKIITKRDSKGKISIEFAWEPNQGLGSGCHAAANEMLKGRASESGKWDDPAEINKQPVNNAEQDDIITSTPQTIHQRM